MASSRLLSFLALLLILLPIAAKGGNFFGGGGKGHNFGGWGNWSCDLVECGKGKCVANSSYPLAYGCECDSGWKRTRDGDNYTYADSFLPCVIPDCSLNYTCQSAPPPVPDRDYPFNTSAFDPCYWAYCGEGTCTRNGTHGFTCECNSGYFNLLNISVFPCYSECTIGSDCSRLGITLADTSTTTTSEQIGQGSSILPGRLHGIVMLLMSMGVVMWS